MAATTTALASSVASMTATATSMIASSMTPTTSSPTATATMNNKTNGEDDGGGDGGRPLLFFVALGFGVVFTNLWIIVGVKYCFRYNQRGRRPQTDPETGEPIDMTNMQRPRRKREKKLLSMDEVNERFPLTKYKFWRATREQEGLPTAGGVTAAPSRAGSIKENMLERTSTERDDSTFAEDQSRAKDGPTGSSDRQSTDAHDFAGNTSTSADEKRPDPSPQPNDTSATAANNTTSTNTTSSNAPASDGTSPQPQDADPDADPDEVRTALPTSTAADLLAGTPGDTCAICIDTLEEEDEVRGLTCGHAFHAGCLDPWLTSRRACCPLCKADYYIPKPRAQRGGTGEAGSEGSGERGEGTGLPQPPANVWMGAGLGRPGWGGHGGHRVRYVVNDTRYGFPIIVRTRPGDPSYPVQNHGQEQDGQQQATSQQPQPANRGIASRFTGMFRRGGQQSTAAPESQSSPEVTNAPEEERNSAPSTTQQQALEPRDAGGPQQRSRFGMFRARPQRFARPPTTTTADAQTDPDVEAQQTSPGQLEAGTRAAA